MLLEAFEILQNSGTDAEALVTDLGIYKVVQILTVYLPLATATFLLSQEFIGEKIACFPPSNFSDHHADPLQEYCWNEGRWISSELAKERTGIYTQPHRYYPLYLPLQAVLFLTPIIIWNILTKSKLLAALKGTEEFLDDLLEEVTKGTGPQVKKKAIILIKQFHETCVSTAENLNLAAIGCWRLGYETLLLLGAVFMQFKLYNRNPKTYHCWIPELTDEEISCTVPILDMLDGLWKINVLGLLASTAITTYMSWKMYVMHTDEFQPLFYNNLPYGDEDEFNEEIKWETTWIKHSYRLLIKIFVENNQIMTRAVVLQALQPDERKRGWKLRLQAKKAKLRRSQRRALSPTMSPRSMSPGSLTPHTDLQPVWPKQKLEKREKPAKSKKDGTENCENPIELGINESPEDEMKATLGDLRDQAAEFPNVSDSGVDSGQLLMKDVTPDVGDSYSASVASDETCLEDNAGKPKKCEAVDDATLEDSVQVVDSVEGEILENDIVDSDPAENCESVEGEILENDVVEQTSAEVGATSIGEEKGIVGRGVKQQSDGSAVTSAGWSTNFQEDQIEEEITEQWFKYEAQLDEAQITAEQVEDYERDSVPENIDNARDMYVTEDQFDESESTSLLGGQSDSLLGNEPKSPTFVTSFNISLRVNNPIRPRSPRSPRSRKRTSYDVIPSSEETVSNEFRFTSSQDVTDPGGDIATVATVTTVGEEQFSTFLPISHSTPQGQHEAGHVSGPPEVGHRAENMEKSSDSDLLAEYEQIPSDKSGQEETGHYFANTLCKTGNVVVEASHLGVNLDVLLLFSVLLILIYFLVSINWSEVSDAIIW